MVGCKEVTACRACGGPLEAVLDLGVQCLAGQFPKAEEPDPPAFPLVLGICMGECGLVQLLHTVDPELMFRDYYYRSGVSLTMQDHLAGIADQAVKLLGRTPSAVLDIGSNDGTLLARLAGKCGCLCVGIDPADVDEAEHAQGVVRRVKGFWPLSLGDKFDLIFSVACFYDADDPVAFARAVHDQLADDGIWVVEVANLWDMLRTTGYDSVCHEHLCYYQPSTMREVLVRAGLRDFAWVQSNMNGGSERYYVRKVSGPNPGHADPQMFVPRDGVGQFADRVKMHRECFQMYLFECRDKKREVHLLGASTKFNTVLQYAGADAELIQAASDRDPRKAGRVTPGTRIPIVSEEGSRALEPDVYLTVLSHFRKELLERERHHLLRGGKVTFVLPGVEEVQG